MLLVRCINTVCDGSSAVKAVSVTIFMEEALKDAEANSTPLLYYVGIKQWSLTPICMFDVCIQYVCGTDVNFHRDNNFFDVKCLHIMPLLMPLLISCDLHIGCSAER